MNTRLFYNNLYHSKIISKFWDIYYKLQFINIKDRTNLKILKAFLEYYSDWFYLQYRLNWNIEHSYCPIILDNLPCQAKTASIIVFPNMRMNTSVLYSFSGSVHLFHQMRILQYLNRIDNWSDHFARGPDLISYKIIVLCIRIYSVLRYIE